MKYVIEPNRINYISNLEHKDLNYGLSVGTSFNFEIKGNNFFSGFGLKFQKISVQVISADSESYGTDTFSIAEYFTSNNIEKNDNLIGWYTNLGYSFGKKKKYNFILEMNGSMNKPIYGSNELYVHNILQEKISYKKNFYFTVFKIRRLF